MAGVINNIKNEAKKAGASKGKFMYFREGQKQRVRFLTDMDDGMEITFHDSFEQGINIPCQELFDKECPYCEDESLRTRSMYVWSVYNYETKEVQLFMFAVNNCSPIPALVAMYENYGTITDRDYIISVSGSKQNKTYSVVPMDKVKFRNAQAKPFAESTILKMLDKAYPCDATEDDDDEELPMKKSKTKSSPKPAQKKTKSKQAVDDDDDDDDYDDESWNDDSDDGDEIDYTEMSPMELYKLCRERKIDVEPKKPAKYYIKQLEDFDKAQDDWDDSDDDDEWEDE